MWVSVAGFFKHSCRTGVGGVDLRVCSTHSQGWHIRCGIRASEFHLILGLRMYRTLHSASQFERLINARVLRSKIPSVVHTNS
jgi:hypothetical protein